MAPNTEELDLRINRENGRVVVNALGEIDISTAPTLDAVLSALICEQGNLRIVVDLQRVAFIGSGGLNVLVKYLQEAQDRGGELLLRSPTAITRKVLDVTGLAAVFVVDQRRPGDNP